MRTDSIIRESVKLLFALTLFATQVVAQENQRVHRLFDDDWQFTLGHAGDPQKDFGCAPSILITLRKQTPFTTQALTPAISWSSVPQTTCL